MFVGQHLLPVLPEKATPAHPPRESQPLGAEKGITGCPVEGKMDGKNYRDTVDTGRLSAGKDQF